MFYFSVKFITTFLCNKINSGFQLQGISLDCSVSLASNLGYSSHVEGS